MPEKGAPLVRDTNECELARIIMYIYDGAIFPHTITTHTSTHLRAIHNMQGNVFNFYKEFLLIQVIIRWLLMRLIC